MSHRIPLNSVLLTLLDTHPDGLSEHAILQLLGEHSVWGEKNFDYHDTLILFQHHFILFHALYRLRDELRAGGLGDLAISPLHIARLAYTSGETALTDPDPLREYYLDIANLENTSAEKIDEMLGRFWTRLHTHDDKSDALKILQLQEPLDRTTIKRQYRKLVMQHHPDRGGDTARLQELNAAVNILLTLYKE